MALPLITQLLILSFIHQPFEGCRSRVKWNDTDKLYYGVAICKHKEKVTAIIPAWWEKTEGA